MATRKDIAREAGVSEGTVSNVLNGRGNVSSEKIRLVEAAIQKLNYTANERAKFLRKGSTNIFGIVLPNVDSLQYAQLYTSFKNYAESHGYHTHLYLTNDNPEVELCLIRQLRSDMIMKVAIVSSLDSPESYLQSGFQIEDLLFVERSVGDDYYYIGFDYAKAGHFFGTQAAEAKETQLAVITGSLSHSHEKAFYLSFTKALREEQRKSLCTIQTDYFQRYHQILHALETNMPEAFYLSNFSYTDTLHGILKNFYGINDPVLHTVSPLFTMPEKQCDKYELNYSLLGQETAKWLLNDHPDSHNSSSVILSSDGKREWKPKISSNTKKETTLRLMLIDAPGNFALRSLASLYTRQTGIKVSYSIYSYDEIYDLFLQPDALKEFDILRLDITALSWFSNQVLIPLEEIDPSVEDLLPQCVSGIANNFSRLNGHIYALPFSPSVQMLYYRKDLFENTMLRRTYQEQYKTELRPPVTFEEFNQIAAFFTKAHNPESPVSYGATLTLGGKGTASSEFMMRYRAYSTRLHGDDGHLHFDTQVASEVLNQLSALKSYTKQPTYRWWTDTADGFASGDVAMCILYSNYASGLLGQHSKVIDKIGVALVPGQNPLLGGASLGVCRYSKQTKEALDFLRWISSEPASSAVALLDGTAIHQSTYNNIDIQTTYPWMRSVQKSFMKIAEKRPPVQSAKPFNERLFLNIIGQATQKAYNGLLTPEEAIQEAKTEICQRIE